MVNVYTGSAPFIIDKIYSRGMPKTFTHDLNSSVVDVGTFLARCSFICWPDSWLQLSLWHEPQLVPMTWWNPTNSVEALGVADAM